MSPHLHTLPEKALRIKGLFISRTADNGIIVTIKNKKESKRLSDLCMDEMISCVGFTSNQSSPRWWGVGGTTRDSP